MDIKYQNEEMDTSEDIRMIILPIILFRLPCGVNVQ